jgi:mRNA interferase MazF
MMTMMPSKPIYKRGQVVLVVYPNSDLQTAKLRPALVVQADNLNTGLAQLLVAMITSNQARRNHPSRVAVTQGSPDAIQAGLLTDSVIMTDNLATVMDKAISRVIGSLSMSNVDVALRHTLGI